ncbi:MAG TPA: glycosyltransferase [Gemmatimonadales bacterium]|nr:glycosyltransferase [Gemmatimonadales bacterium]
MPAPRTLLYLNFDFPPMSGPGIWRALGFIKYLPDHNWRTIVVCSDRSPSRDRFDPSLAAQIPANTEVHRLHSWFENDILLAMERVAERTSVKLLSRLMLGVHWRFRRDWPDYLFNWTLKAARVGAWLAFRQKPDCLFTSGPPHLAHAAGRFINRLTGIPWVMDYRDLWTDDDVQVKPTRYRDRIARIERSSVARCEAVTGVSPVHLDIVAKRFANVKPRDRFFLIRNGHDLPDAVIERSLFQPRNAQMHVHFNGTPQVTHPFLLILDLLDRLPSEQRPLFTFTGLPPRVKEAVEQRGYQQYVQDVGHMSQMASVDYSTQCDVLLAMVNAASPVYRGTIPGKVYEAIALGRHLLAVLPRGSTVGDLIDDPRTGTMVDVEDFDALYRALLRLLELHRTGQLNADQDPARRRALAERHSRKHQTAQLVELLDFVTRRRAQPPGFSLAARP